MSGAIGFDYGERRIGVAVSVFDMGTANPLTTISTNMLGIPWDKIDKIIKEWQPSTIIVGCVEHSTQNNNLLKKKIRRFCDNLTTRYHVPVETIDEAYSSATAYEILKDMRSKDQRKKISKSDVDKASAAIILNSWLYSNLDSNMNKTNA